MSLKGPRISHMVSKLQWYALYRTKPFVQVCWNSKPHHSGSSSMHTFHSVCLKTCRSSIRHWPQHHHKTCYLIITSSSFKHSPVWKIDVFPGNEPHLWLWTGTQTTASHEQNSYPSNHNNIPWLSRIQSQCVHVLLDIDNVVVISSLAQFKQYTHQQYALK